jgi:hypothetical protein
MTNESRVKRHCRPAHWAEHGHSEIGPRAVVLHKAATTGRAERALMSIQKQMTVNRGSRTSAGEVMERCFSKQPCFPGSDCKHFTLDFYFSWASLVSGESVSK